MDYGRLFSKLFTYKFQNSNKDQKKPKVLKMYYLIEKQSKLLDFCGFKNFKTPLAFKNVGEVNDFVSQYVQNKIIFEKKMECYLAHVLNLPI